MTHAEILAAYPRAVAAEPLPERTATRAATVIERDELLALVAAQKVAGAVAGCNPKKAPVGCSTCRHRKRPGRADPGYCSAREDLPGAYGLHHPLRRLPDDQGATCASYKTFED